MQRIYERLVLKHQCSFIRTSFFKEHLQWFLLTVSGSSLQLYSLKETLAKMFICEFCKIFKNIFRQNTSGWLHLWILRSFSDHFFYRETACFMHKFKRISTTRCNKKHFTSGFQVFYIRTRSSYSKAFIYLKSLKIICEEVNL